nr:hypothetical protein [Ammoniphilus resinae]
MFISVYLLIVVSKLDSRVKSLKYTLTQFTKENNIPENHPINDELRKLINEGNDVKAVKKVRETFGLPLLEAKQYVDALKLETK